MKIRSYIPQDYDKIRNIFERCGIYRTEIDGEDNINLKIKHSPDSIIVAEENKSLIGTVFIIFDPWLSLIYHLAVDPDYQHKGIGTKLMSEAELRLKNKGARKIVIYVEKKNKNAINFYKKRNWSLVGESLIFAKI
jgi:ribosomal protein S18 acetylase RimI-like enzyme